MRDSISLYIDNELNLDEKIDFIKRIHEDRQFFSEAVDLLEQEKLLCSDVVEEMPQISFREKPKMPTLQFLRPYFRWRSLLLLLCFCLLLLQAGCL
jgi:hypothetical protein